MKNKVFIIFNARIQAQAYTCDFTHTSHHHKQQFSFSTPSFNRDSCTALKYI